MARTPSSTLNSKKLTILTTGWQLSATAINEDLDNIFKVGKASIPSLQCQSISHTRYQALVVSKRFAVTMHIQYFFALNLHQNLELLPQLLGSIIEVARFLGPTNCAISIVEGNSSNSTTKVLHAIKPLLERIGITYAYRSHSTDLATGDHIVDLATLRNYALAPLLYSKRADVNTSVVFINDVAICPDDILELVLQKRNLGAHMTCAMDWTYTGHHALFYDVWTARTITGHLFYKNLPSHSRDSSWSLFPQDTATKKRYEKNQPFQVFSCWNGAAVFTAKPILQGLSFRGPLQTECTHSEFELFCKDLWLRGYGKIAVIPTVNLQHAVEKGRIKRDKGHVSDLVGGQEAAEERIDWLHAPKHVECVPELL